MTYYLLSATFMTYYLLSAAFPKHRQTSQVANNNNNDCTNKIIILNVIV